MSLEQDIRRLQAIPLLGELDLEALRLIAFSAETRSFRTGDVLFRTGEEADGGFVVLSGRIEVESVGEGVQQAGPGVLIGARALLSPIARPATATAREATSVLKITRRLFYRVLEEFPSSADRLQRALAREIAERLSGLGPAAA